MRLFGDWFTDKYKYKLINIHPSLLPLFPGMDLNVHKQVLESGYETTGCTIHFVDKGTDTGLIIAQETVRIEGNDDVNSLKLKVQEKEKMLYPKIIQKFADNKISVFEDRKVIIED